MTENKKNMTMTNDQIREEMMNHIEYLKMVDICNKAGLHNKDEKRIREETRERIQELYDMLLEVEG